MTTYKIKKEFIPMDFYDYVKSRGREKCEEFKKDFDYWVTHTGPFIQYTTVIPDIYSTLGYMLSERTNFRRYMIEGGFVEEEKPKTTLKFWLDELNDSYKLRCDDGVCKWCIGYFYKDGSGAFLEGYITSKDLQHDSLGRIKILSQEG